MEKLQQSKPGMFVKKVLDDQAPNLAALLAWGTLSAILPLVLGILSISGLVLRDPERLDQVYGMMSAAVPGAQGPVGEALQSVRTAAAAPAGVVSIILLLFNGSAFFANMAGVFDQVYHVPSRNFVVQRLVAVLMLVITTALLVVSTLALGIGSLVGNIPIGLPVGPLVARIVSWSVSIVSAIVLFLLLYRILPNAKKGWRNVLPGSLLAAVLFFAITMVFPIYTSLFPPNHAYAIMGVFLVFTFYLYLLGFVFVLGCELNAFLQEPARSAALAEATERAHHGKAQYNVQGGEVKAETTGDAPAVSGAGPLGAPARSSNQQVQEQAQNGAPGVAADQGATGPARPSLAGRLLGFVGLILAVFLLRGRSPAVDDQSARA
jgi:membrane protein